MSAIASASSRAFAVRSSGKTFSAPSLAPRVGRRTSVAVRAATEYPKPVLPKGVTVPSAEPSAGAPMFGFVHFAEKMNSRAAMIGFFSLLALEAITGKGLLELMGTQVGSGLGFEF
eukprot:gene24894-10560_t